MPLTVGSRLGPYDVVALIGEGHGTNAPAWLARSEPDVDVLRVVASDVQRVRIAGGDRGGYSSPEGQGGTQEDVLRDWTPRRRDPQFDTD